MSKELSVSVRLTREQVGWLKTAAEEVRESMSWILRDLVEQARLSDEDDDAEG